MFRTPLCQQYLFRIFNCNAEVGGGRAGGRAGVNFWFPLNNFSLLWPMNTKLAV